METQSKAGNRCSVPSAHQPKRRAKGATLRGPGFKPFQCVWDTFLYCGQQHVTFTYLSIKYARQRSGVDRVFLPSSKSNIFRSTYLLALAANSDSCCARGPVFVNAFRHQTPLYRSKTFQVEQEEERRQRPGGNLWYTRVKCLLVCGKQKRLSLQERCRRSG